MQIGNRRLREIIGAVVGAMTLTAILLLSGCTRYENSDLMGKWRSSEELLVLGKPVLSEGDIFSDGTSQGLDGSSKRKLVWIVRSNNFEKFYDAVGKHVEIFRVKLNGNTLILSNDYTSIQYQKVDAPPTAHQQTLDVKHRNASTSPTNQSSSPPIPPTISFPKNTPAPTAPQAKPAPVLNPNDLVTCPSCSGAGFTRMASSPLTGEITCQYCGGRGWRVINGIMNDCIPCNGTGKGGLVCFACQGNGRTTRQYASEWIRFSHSKGNPNSARPSDMEDIMPQIAVPDAPAAP